MSDGADGAAELARKAASFAWSDITTDLAKLDEIARGFHSDGAFSLIGDFHLPDGDDPDGEGWMQMSPVMATWQRWLAEKYDRDTSFVVLAKFGQLVCNSSLSTEDNPKLN